MEIILYLEKNYTLFGNLAVATLHITFGCSGKTNWLPVNTRRKNMMFS